MVLPTLRAQMLNTARLERRIARARLDYLKWLAVTSCNFEFRENGTFDEAGKQRQAFEEIPMDETEAAKAKVLQLSMAAIESAKGNNCMCACCILTRLSAEAHEKAKMLAEPYGVVSPPPPDSF